MDWSDYIWQTFPEVLTSENIFRLSGIGSKPGYPDCTPWDDWSVGGPLLIAVSHLLTIWLVTYGAIF